MVYKETTHTFFYDTFIINFFFLNPTDQKFGTHKKMTLKSQPKIKSPFP